MEANPAWRVSRLLETRRDEVGGWKVTRVHEKLCIVTGFVVT